MEIDELNCQICKKAFDDCEKQPTLLNECGHTFCEACLLEIYSTKGSIICPEDGTVYNKSAISLPKNKALINIIIKAMENLKSGLRSLNSPHSSMENQSTGKGDGSNNTLCQIRQSKCASYYENLCDVHKRPREVVCIDHKEKICTMCALFGDHKDHHIRTQEDVVKEISNNVEAISEYTQRLEEKFLMSNVLIENQFKKVEEIKNKFKETSEESKNKIKSYFREISNLLKIKETQLLEEIDLKFENSIYHKIRGVEGIPTVLNTFYEYWRTRYIY